MVTRTSLSGRGRVLERTWGAQGNGHEQVMGYGGRKAIQQPFLLSLNFSLSGR
jgi:hypothetical protein